MDESNLFLHAAYTALLVIAFLHLEPANARGQYSTIEYQPFGN